MPLAFEWSLNHVCLQEYGGLILLHPVGHARIGAGVSCLVLAMQLVAMANHPEAETVMRESRTVDEGVSSAMLPTRQGHRLGAPRAVPDTQNQECEVWKKFTRPG